MADLFPEHKERQGAGWRERGHSTLLEALAWPGEQPDLFFLVLGQELLYV